MQERTADKLVLVYAHGECPRPAQCRLRNTNNVVVGAHASVLWETAHLLNSFL